MIKQLREEYKKLNPTGKGAFNGWSEEQLLDKIAEFKGSEISDINGRKMPVITPEEIPKKQEPVPKPIDVNPTREKFDALPPPIKEHLIKTFGNWLNYFEVGQEWVKGYGGYGMYIKVPREFSTEWVEENVMQYDNAAMAPATDEHGNRITKKIVRPDIRMCPLNNMTRTIGWINQVKQHILNKAADKGLILPSTQTEYQPEKKPTREEYAKSLHN